MSDINTTAFLLHKRVTKLNNFNTQGTLMTQTITSYKCYVDNTIETGTFYYNLA